MKYFIFSLLLHLLVGGIGFAIKSNGNTFLESKLDQQMIVDIISIPQKSRQASNNQKKERILKKKRLKNKKMKSSSKKAIKQLVSVSNANDLEEKNLERAASQSYAMELKSFLEKSKHYPRQAVRLKQSGIVVVQVKIDAKGVFEEIRLNRASTFPVLDQAAMGLLKRLGKFKPLPKNIPANTRFVIPIAYVMGQTK